MTDVFSGTPLFSAVISATPRSRGAPHAKGLAHTALHSPTAREPTVRAAKGCRPPFIATSFTARGGQRPQAATRQERVICRQIRRLPPRQARLQRLDRSIATVVKNLRTQVWQQAPGVHHVLAIMSAELLEQLRFLGWNHDVSNGDGRDYGQSPNQPVRCNQSCRNE